MELVIRERIELYVTDSPSVVLLEVLKIPMGNKPSFRTIRAANKMLEAYVESDVVIESPNSPYDCTGKSFTSSIDLVKKEIVKGMVGNMHNEQRILIAVYKHHISVDV